VITVRTTDAATGVFREVKLSELTRTGAGRGYGVQEEQGESVAGEMGSSAGGVRGALARVMILRRNARFERA